MNIYDFTVKAADGSDFKMQSLKGKVVIIVNTATECGFTPQYKDLQAIYRAHKDDGVEILDFPCNQFANQAPGTVDEIRHFCEVRFGVTFPTMAKIDVKGEDQDPLFKYLEENSTFGGFKGEKAELMNTLMKKLDPDFEKGSDIKWNFTKFLIDREGNIVKRYEVTDPMKELAKDVEGLL